MVLRYEPDELFNKFGFIFNEDYDNLDDYKFTALEDKQIGQILLLRYRNHPIPGTEVHVDSLISVKDVYKVLHNELQLDLSDITWRLDE